MPKESTMKFYEIHITRVDKPPIAILGILGYTSAVSLMEIIVNKNLDNVTQIEVKEQKQ